jgi:hypothetical protein
MGLEKFLLSIYNVIYLVRKHPVIQFKNKTKSVPNHPD